MQTQSHSKLYRLFLGLTLLLSPVAYSISVQPMQNPASMTPMQFGLVKAKFYIQLRNPYATGAVGITPPKWVLFLTTCPQGTTWVDGADPNISTATGTDYKGKNYNLKNCICSKNKNSCPTGVSFSGNNFGDTSWVKCENSSIQNWFPSTTFNVTYGTVPDITGTNNYRYCANGYDDATFQGTCDGLAASGSGILSGTTIAAPGYMPPTFVRSIQFDACL